MPAKRRTSGEGGLYRDGNLWIGSVDLGRGPDGRRRRAKVKARTQREARAKLAELRRRVDDGLPIGDQRTTVADYLADWVEHRLPASVKSPNTVDSLRWAVHRHLVPALGARRLRDLTADDVEDMLRERAAAGMSGSSLRRIHSTLTRALRAAERRGLVTRNVAALVDTPAGPETRARSLTVEQAGSLLAAARGHRLEAAWVTGLMAGLRPGELLGLAWSDVDLDAARLHVSRSLKRQRDGLLIGEPKTAASRRTLDLPAPVVAALRTHKARQAGEHLAAGVAWVDTGLVFTTTIGTPIDPSNLRREFGKVTAAAGLGHWHPHELRHSAASILSAAGVPIEVVADVLGHRGARTTMAVYRHRITQSVDAAQAPMDRLFGAER